MGFKVDADLVPLFRGLVTGLQPFATAQEVELSFESSVRTIVASYNPEEALSEITVLLSRTITFTPQSHGVKVSLKVRNANTDVCILEVKNTGVDLSKVGEILSAVKKGLLVKRLGQGTIFRVSIPTKPELSIQDTSKRNCYLLPKQYPMYFTAINQRLSFHFSNTENIEKGAELKGNSEGVFLKKVNAVIQSRLDDPEFKVDALADAMALSRTQLFRKLKGLTKMSPQKYLRFVRLDEAKKLLQSSDKDLNVSEVCYSVGFASKSHFTRSFQKEFGFNPSDFK